MAYIWNLKITNNTGAQIEYMAATETDNITENTKFYFCDEHTTEIPADDAPFIQINSGLTVTEEAVKQVNYNKNQNWVIIGATTNGRGQVLSVGTKVVPDSQGAKYTFTWPGEVGGPFYETFIVGETMVPEGYIFDGRWSFLGKYSGLVFQNEASNNCYFVDFDSEEGEFIVSSWCM